MGGRQQPTAQAPAANTDDSGRCSTETRRMTPFSFAFFLCGLIIVVIVVAGGASAATPTLTAVNPPTPTQAAQFGSQLALSADGSIVLVASYVYGGDPGVYAYLCFPSNVTCRMTASFTSSDAAAGGHFGSSLALNENATLFAFGGDASNSTGNYNKVYVFFCTISSATSGLQSSKCTSKAIVSPNGVNSGDQFGIADTLSISGSLLAVGAPDATNGYFAGGGAVYVYSCKSNACTPKSTLEPTDPAAQMDFGRTVLVVGSTVLVGAAFSGTSGQSEGVVYVFDCSLSTACIETTKLTDPSGTGSQFGRSMAYSAGNLAIFCKNFIVLYNCAQLPQSCAFGSYVPSFAGSAISFANGNLLLMNGLYSNFGTVYTFYCPTLASCSQTVGVLSVTPQPTDNDYFGIQLATANNGFTVAAATQATVGSVTGAGVVYLFSTSNNTLTAAPVATTTPVPHVVTPTVPASAKQGTQPSQIPVNLKAFVAMCQEANFGTTIAVAQTATSTTGFNLAVSAPSWNNADGSRGVVVLYSCATNASLTCTPGAALTPVDGSSSSKQPGPRAPPDDVAPSKK